MTDTSRPTQVEAATALRSAKERLGLLQRAPKYKLGYGRV